MFGRAIAEKAYQELAALREKGPISQELWISTVARVADEEISPTAKLKPLTRIERNVLFDALARLVGCNVSEMTKSKASEITKSLSDIRGAMPDLTSQELERRAAKFREKHPTWELTPSSLAKWWSVLGAPMDKIDVYQEPAGDWRSVLIRIAGVEYSEATWAQVRNQFGRRIWQQML